MRRLQTAAIAAALGIVAPVLAAQAQEKFPSRPIQLIVPSPPGGGTDTTARTIAALAEPILGQRVVVVNKPGAGGVIGIDAMLQAKPDGYTLAGVWNAPITVTPLIFDVDYKLDSYVPVEISDVAPTVYCVMKDFPANTGQELINELRARPDKYTYGTDGASGTVQLTADVILTHFGVKARAVPFKGATETLTAFSGRYIDIYGGSTVPVLPLVKNGTAKCLIVSTDTTSSVLPGASNMTDLGIPQDASLVWHAVLAPAGIPADRLAILEHAFRAAAASDKYKAFAATQGEDAPAMSSADSRKEIDREYHAFSEVVQRLGLKQGALKD